MPKLGRSSAVNRAQWHQESGETIWEALLGTGVQRDGINRLRIKWRRNEEMRLAYAVLPNINFV